MKLKHSLKRMLSFVLTVFLIMGTFPFIISAAPNQLLAVNFDDGSLGGFYAKGCTVEPTAELSFNGDHSLKVTGRTANWNGAEINVTNYITAGNEYEISVMVHALTPDSSNFIVTSQIGSDKWQTIAKSTTVATSDGWVEMKGTYLYTDSDTATGSITVYVENEDPNAEFYIDNFTLTQLTDVVSNTTTTAATATAASAPIVVNFDDGTMGGFNGNGCTAAVTDEIPASSGTNSLKVIDRTANWAGPKIDVTSNLIAGHTYESSVMVHMLATGDAAAFNLSIDYTPTGGNEDWKQFVFKQSVSYDNGWTLLKGTWTVPAEGLASGAIYVENDALLGFYIDDFTLTDLGGTTPVTLNPDLTGPGLKDIYKDYFYIGDIFQTRDVSIPQRLALLGHEFNAMTAEYEMKPDPLIVGTTPDKPNFSGINATISTILKDVLGNSGIIHGHTLVWYQVMNIKQTPSIFNDASGNTLSAAKVQANIDTYIKAVMTNFKGDNVHSWDVVNEAIVNSPNPQDWKNSMWTKADGNDLYAVLGSDYVYNAFVAARKVQIANGTNELLYYNDYNLNNANKAQTVYNMVKDLNARYKLEYPKDPKQLIQGIGMQGHYNLSTLASDVENTLKLFSTLGVKVSISELDIKAGNTPEDLEKQAATYAQLFEVFKNYAAGSANKTTNPHLIERVTFWGLDDGTSWIASNNPLLFNADLTQKSAYKAVANPEAFLATYVPPPAPVVKEGTAASGTPTVDAKIDSVWSTTASIPMDTKVEGNPTASGTVKLLWDKDNLYALYQVSDSDLDKASVNPWEQDSVEAFVDENDAKTSSYQTDDGQYRVNYENTTSFGSPTNSTGFKSAVALVDGGYIVEMSIPWKEITPETGTVIGFDAQINDGSAGKRIGVLMWGSDPNSYQDTRNWGNVTLLGASSSNPATTSVPAAPANTTSAPATTSVPVAPANTTSAPVTTTVPTTPAKTQVPYYIYYIPYYYYYYIQSSIR